MDRRSDDDTSDPPNLVSAPAGIQSEPRPREVTWVERLAAAALALLLVVLCVLVVRPFLSAALWAVVLCTSTWGLFQRLAQSMGNHRSLAALLMTLALTVAIVGPFALVGFSLVEQVRDTAGVIKQAVGTDPFSLTPGLNKVPIIGARLGEYYRNFLGGEISVVEQLKRLSGPVGRTILKWSKALGNGLWQLCLSLLIGFFFYRDGEALGARIGNLATRIAGPQRGTRLLRLAQDTCGGGVRSGRNGNHPRSADGNRPAYRGGSGGTGPGFSDLPAVRVAGWGSTDLDTCGDLVIFTKPRRLGAVPLALGAGLQFPGRRSP